MNGSRQECSTVWTVRCGYGAVVDGQGGPRVAGSSGLDAVGRKTRLTPRADQLNRGDAPDSTDSCFDVRVGGEV